MNIPIVMAAFGTTTEAADTYSFIDSRIRDRFPGHQILWGYSSRAIKKVLNETEGQTIYSPVECLEQLASQGHRGVVVQPLYFLAGNEFHRLKKEAGAVSINTRFGLPILSSPTDYRRTSEGLARFLQSRRDDEALVLVGHGSLHPSWSGFLALEYFLRERFSSRIFLGCVEHFPSAEETVARIIEGGWKKVCLVPFLLVAGYHFQKQLMGDDPDSWKSVCRAASLAVTAIDRGMGMESFLSDILVSHIYDAINAIAQ